MSETPQEEKEELQRLVERLTALGENHKELRFWEAVFDELDQGDRRDLLDNLHKEVRRLDQLGNDAGEARP